MEDLEQLKVLENGYRMKVTLCCACCVVPHLLMCCLALRCPLHIPIAPRHVVCPQLSSSTSVSHLSVMPRQRSSPPAAVFCPPQVVVVEHSAHGVDMPEDVASLEAIMRKQGIQ